MRRTSIWLLMVTGLGGQHALAQEPPDAWSIETRGRGQYDVGYVDAPDAVPDDGLGLVDEFRTLRLGVEGRVAGAFDYVLEFDFSQNDFALADAALTYETGPIALTFGHQKNLTGLEELTSGRFTSFIERAAFTDAFGFERRIGLAAAYANEDISIGGGVFTDDFDALADDANDGYSLDARAVWHPEIGEGARLHLGGSVHWRDIRQTDEIAYRQRPLIHATDIRFIATPDLPVEAELSYGLEAALVRGRFHAAAEVHWLRPSLAGAGDPGFFGGYLEAGWFLTEDTRGYSGSRFDRVRPTRPLGEGGIGAVQVNLRYDYLDLNDVRIVGGRQNLLGGSLIWTPRADLRLMLTYAAVAYDDAAIAANGERDYWVDVAALRAQFDF